MERRKILGKKTSKVRSFRPQEEAQLVRSQRERNLRRAFQSFVYDVLQRESEIVPEALAFKVD